MLFQLNTLVNVFLRSPCQSTGARGGGGDIVVMTIVMSRRWPRHNWCESNINNQ